MSEQALDGLVDNVMTTAESLTKSRTDAHLERQMFEDMTASSSRSHAVGHWDRVASKSILAPNTFHEENEKVQSCMVRIYITTIDEGDTNSSLSIDFPLGILRSSWVELSAVTFAPSRSMGEAARQHFILLLLPLFKLRSFLRPYTTTVLLQLVSTEHPIFQYLY